MRLRPKGPPVSFSLFRMRMRTISEKAIVLTARKGPVNLKEGIPSTRPTSPATRGAIARLSQGETP